MVILQGLEASPVKPCGKKNTPLSLPEWAASGSGPGFEKKAQAVPAAVREEDDTAGARQLYQHAMMIIMTDRKIGQIISPR